MTTTTVRCYNHNRQNELRHYGILGMKGGVRKEYKPKGRKRGKAKDKPKSKHRLKLEDEYRQKGMNTSDAEKKAAKRAKIEKVLITAGVLTVAAAATYAALHNEDIKRFMELRVKMEILPESFESLSEIKGKHSIADDALRVNPKFKTGKEYYT